MTAIPVLSLTQAQATDLTDGGDSALHYHAADRALANATGTLDVPKGGTGAASFTAGRLLIGNGTGAITEDANLKWDGTQKGLSIGGATHTTQLDILKDDNTNTAIASFKANNGTQGVEIRYSGVYSTGSNDNVDLILQPKGTGSLILGVSGSALQLDQGGQAYALGNSINALYGTNARDSLYLNYAGYAGGGTQFRDLEIRDGKATTKFKFSVDSPVALLPASAGGADLGSATYPFGSLYLDYTNTATVGNVTMNKASGTVNLGAAGTTLTLTNSLITANSRIMLTLASNPGVAIGSLYAVPAAGSCTINVTTAVVNQTKISFEVIN